MLVAHSTRHVPWAQRNGAQLTSAPPATLSVVASLHVPVTTPATHCARVGSQTPPVTQSLSFRHLVLHARVLLSHVYGVHDSEVGWQAPAPSHAEETMESCAHVRWPHWLRGSRPAWTGLQVPVPFVLNAPSQLSHVPVHARSQQ